MIKTLRYLGMEKKAQICDSIPWLLFSHKQWQFKKDVVMGLNISPTKDTEVLGMVTLFGNKVLTIARLR